MYMSTHVAHKQCFPDAKLTSYSKTSRKSQINLASFPYTTHLGCYKIVNCNKIILLIFSGKEHITLPVLL